MFLTLSTLTRSLRSFAARRLFVCLLTASVISPALPALSLAADMTDVHKAIDAGHLFDAFEDLLDLAKAGNPEAQYELAGFYHWGRVGAANFTKARDWYQRAANQGNVDAMIGLAVMNAAGNGGPVDKATAAKWLIIASNTQQLPPNVAQWRDELTDQLTPAEVTAIKAEAQAFKPKLEK
jgi:TPR repeat protein